MAAGRRRIYSSPAATMRAMPSPPAFPASACSIRPGRRAFPTRSSHAMARQPTDLADPRLAELIAACESGLKALLQHRARRGVLLCRQRPRRLGGGDRQPGRAGHGGAGAGHRPLLRRLGRAGRGVRRRRACERRTARASDRSGGGRGGAARRHARTASPRSSSSTPTPRAARPATSRRCAARSTPPAIRRCSSSTSSRRSPPRRSRWTRSASTSRSARRRRG